MKRLFPIVVLAVVGGLWLVPGMSRPFIGHHAMNGAQFGIMARNHLRYGLAATKLGQVESVDWVEPASLKFNAHHPFLYPVMLAGSFAIFGESEATARGLSIGLTILASWVIFKFVSRNWGTMTGLVSGLIFLITPMVIHFGKMPVHEPVVLVFLLTQVDQYQLWIETRKRRYFWGSVGWSLVACLVAWPAFYLTPILIGHAWLTRPELRREVWGLVVAPVVAMGWHLLHTRWLTGSVVGGGLTGVFLARILRVETKQVGLLPSLGWVEFVRLQVNWMMSYYTRVLGLLSGWWLVRAGWRLTGRRSSEKQRTVELLVGGLLVLGLAHVVVNPTGAANHEYMLYYLAPFMAVSGGIVLGGLRRWLPGKIWLGVVVGVLGLMVWSSRGFLMAVEQAEFHLPGYKLGIILGEELGPGEKAMIASTQFQSFFGHIVKYYADRMVNSADLGVSEVEGLRRSYKLVVVPESHLPKDERLVSYLEERFEVKTREGFRLYDLGQH